MLRSERRQDVWYSVCERVCRGEPQTDSSLLACDWLTDYSLVSPETPAAPCLFIPFSLPLLFTFVSVSAYLYSCGMCFQESTYSVLWSTMQIMLSWLSNTVHAGEHTLYVVCMWFWFPLSYRCVRACMLDRTLGGNSEIIKNPQPAACLALCQETLLTP